MQSEIAVQSILSALDAESEAPPVGKPSLLSAQLSELDPTELRVVGE